MFNTYVTIIAIITIIIIVISVLLFGKVMKNKENTGKTVIDRPMIIPKMFVTFRKNKDDINVTSLATQMSLP